MLLVGWENGEGGGEANLSSTVLAILSLLFCVSEKSTYRKSNLTSVHRWYRVNIIFILFEVTDTIRCLAAYSPTWPKREEPLPSLFRILQTFLGHREISINSVWAEFVECGVRHLLNSCLLLKPLIPSLR